MVWYNGERLLRPMDAFDVLCNGRGKMIPNWSLLLVSGKIVILSVFTIFSSIFLSKIIYPVTQCLKLFSFLLLKSLDASWWY